MPKKAPTFQSKITTPQELYDLFMLCLWWQWSSEHFRNMWTTVDKVLTILQNLEIVNEVAAKQVRRRDDVRRVFRRSLFMCFSGFFGNGEKAATNGILGRPERLVLYGGDRLNVQDRLLHDARIYLSSAGAKYASEIEARYAHILCRETYVAENDRRNAEFKVLDEQVRAGMRKRYRARKDREISNEQRASRKRRSATSDAPQQEQEQQEGDLI